MIQLNMEDVVLLKITLLTKTRKLTDQNRFNIENISILVLIICLSFIDVETFVF